MSYTTRNANLILLFLILLIASSLVGATTFFQHRFAGINEQHNTKLAELNNLTTQVENYRNVLQKAQLELELKQNREEQFTEKYTQVKATSEQLAKTKAELETEVTTLTDQLSQKTTQVSTLTNQVLTVSAQLKTANSNIAALEKKVDGLKDDVSCLKSTADLMEGNC